MAEKANIPACDFLVEFWRRRQPNLANVAHIEVSPELWNALEEEYLKYPKLHWPSQWQSCKNENFIKVNWGIANLDHHGWGALLVRKNQVYEDPVEDVTD